MEKIQLRRAQRTKMPSERQMTQALQPTRLGVALLRVTFAAHWMARYQPSQTPIRAAMRSSCSRIRVKGAACNAGSRRLSTARAAEAGGDGPGDGQQWSQPQGDPLYFRLDGRSRLRYLLTGLHGVAERKAGEVRRDCGCNAGRPGSRGGRPRECRSPSARAVPCPTGPGASSNRRRCAAETEFPAHDAPTSQRC